VLLELVLSCLALQRLVAMRLRHSHPHLLSVHFKARHLLDSFQSRLPAIEHDKSLALPLQAALRNYIDNSSIVREDGVQRLLHDIDLDALLEIADLEFSISTVPRSAM
jgi:hypothetical protein